MYRLYSTTESNTTDVLSLKSRSSCHRDYPRRARFFYYIIPFFFGFFFFFYPLYRSSVCLRCLISSAVCYTTSSLNENNVLYMELDTYSVGAANQRSKGKEGVQQRVTMSRVNRGLCGCHYMLLYIYVELYKTRVHTLYILLYERQIS